MRAWIPAAVLALPLALLARSSTAAIDADGGSTPGKGRRAAQPALYAGDEPEAYVRAHAHADSLERRTVDLICAAPLTYIPATRTHVLGRPALRRIFGSRCFDAPFRAVLAALDAESVLAMVVRAVVFYGTVGAVPEHVVPRDMVVLTPLRRMQRVVTTSGPFDDKRLTRLNMKRPPEQESMYTFRTGAKLQRGGPGSAVVALLVRQALRTHCHHWTRWALGAAVDEPRMLAAVVARILEADDADAITRMLDADRECRASLQMGHVFAYRPALPLNGALRTLLARLDELPFHMADVGVIVARQRWDMLAYVAAGTHLGRHSPELRTMLEVHLADILGAVRAITSPAFALAWLPGLVVGLCLADMQSTATGMLREHVLRMPDTFERMLTYAMPALNWKPCEDADIRKAVGAPRIAGLLALRYALWLRTAVHRERIAEIENVVASGRDPREHNISPEELALARSGRVGENTDSQPRQLLAHQIALLAADFPGGEAALATAAFRGAMRLVRPDIAVCVAAIYTSFEPGTRVVDRRLAEYITSMALQLEDREVARLQAWVRDADYIDPSALRILERRGQATFTSADPIIASRSLLPSVHAYIARKRRV